MTVPCNVRVACNVLQVDVEPQRIDFRELQWNLRMTVTEGMQNVGDRLSRSLTRLDPIQLPYNGNEIAAFIHK